MKLKSCPFCADIYIRIRITKAIHLYEDISYQAMCLHCGATAGHPRMTKESAIKAWNSRADGWISVENRLPEEYELVLVTNGLNHYWLDRIIPDRGWSGSDEEWDGPGDAPTHWMPLPDPPEDE